MKTKNFKVGDLVKLKISDDNWNEDMDYFHEMIVEIKQILEMRNGKTRIRFDEDNGWEFVYEDGHFELYEKAKPVVNKHSIIDDEISYQESLLNNITFHESKKINELKSDIEGIKSKRRKIDYNSITIKLNYKP